MSRELSNAIFLALAGVGLFGFFVGVYAYARLVAKAWRMPDRKAALRQVFGIKGGSGEDWSTETREARMIYFAALCGLIFFVGLLTLLALAGRDR
ncbi:hypothetical protein EON82_22560 [bacterium]|nr:MAG: hypothetical protein EON82_22560 [bacterium]